MHGARSAFREAIEALCDAVHGSAQHTAHVSGQAVKCESGWRGFGEENAGCGVPAWAVESLRGYLLVRVQAGVGSGTMLALAGPDHLSSYLRTIVTL